MHLYILFVLVLFSLCLNIWQFKSVKKQKPKKLTLDAQQMLHDLSNGGTVIKVTVMDPEGLMYYRGKA